MDKKKIKISALATGTLVLGAVASSYAATGETRSFEDLGSGAEFRSELLANNSAIEFIDNREMELKCGEGTCGEKPKKGEKVDPEAVDEDGNLIQQTKEEKASQLERDAARSEAEKQEKGEKKESKKSDSKATEHKCGEGTCG